jgi:hypothetical protein
VENGHPEGIIITLNQIGFFRCVSDASGWLEGELGISRTISVVAIESASRIISEFSRIPYLSFRILIFSSSLGLSLMFNFDNNNMKDTTA